MQVCRIKILCLWSAGAPSYIAVQERIITYIKQNEIVSLIFACTCESNDAEMTCVPFVAEVEHTAFKFQVLQGRLYDFDMVVSDSRRQITESLIIELCKSYAWQLSCNLDQSRQDAHSAQVAPVHLVEMELANSVYAEFYKAIVEYYGSLEDFLLSVPSERVSMHSSPFTLWSFHITLSAHYKREASHRFLPPVEKDALKHNFLIIIFPPTTSLTNSYQQPSMNALSAVRTFSQSSFSFHGAVTRGASDQPINSMSTNVPFDALSHEIEILFEACYPTRHHTTYMYTDGKLLESLEYEISERETS